MSAAVLVAPMLLAFSLPPRMGMLDWLAKLGGDSVMIANAGNQLDEIDKAIKKLEAEEGSTAKLVPDCPDSPA